MGPEILLEPGPEKREQRLECRLPIASMDGTISSVVTKAIKGHPKTTVC